MVPGPARPTFVQLSVKPQTQRCNQSEILSIKILAQLSQGKDCVWCYSAVVK